MGVFHRYRVSALLVGVAAFAAIGLLLRPGSSGEIRWAHVYEINSPYHQEALAAAAEFEALTGGQYRVRVYPASVLGNEVELNEALRIGAIDVIYTGPSLVAPMYPPIAIAEYPFAIDDFAHWKAFRNSSLFDEIATNFREATGITVAGFVYYGFRHVTANRPIRHPDDMRNLKIRVPNAPMYLLMPDNTGANSTPMPFAEVYLALQQGVVDAQENPLTTIRFKRFYEVQSHISLTGHMSNSLLILASSHALARLDDPTRAELLRVLAAAGDRASAEIDQQERELADWFRAQGVTVVDVDREAFRRRLAPALAAAGKPVGQEYFARLRALADQ